MNEKLKIVFVCGWYSSPFGYIHNNLPKALAKKGHEVHIVTSNSQQYSNTPDYESTYESFLGPKYAKIGTTIENGVTIHRLPFSNFKTEIYPKGVFSILNKLKPDVVHIFDLTSLLSFKLAIYKPLIGYKLINSNHILQSVFPLYKNWNSTSLLSKLKWNLLHKLPGKLIHYYTDLTIYPTSDAKDLALNFFGFKNKKNILKSLSVDTELFSPHSDIKIKQLKILNGFKEDDFVCVYTGRFSEDKNPLLLAKAIKQLRTKYPDIKGFFVGDGPQTEEIKSIDGCLLHPFVKQDQLSDFYNIGSLGVWPRQESTSMLDCLACGTPIIVNSTVKATERVEGNGEIYELDSIESLAKTIEKLYLDKKLLDLYSKVGREKIISNFSWDKYADEYIQLMKG